MIKYLMNRTASASLMQVTSARKPLDQAQVRLNAVRDHRCHLTFLMQWSFSSEKVTQIGA